MRRPGPNTIKRICFASVFLTLWTWGCTVELFAQRSVTLHSGWTNGSQFQVAWQSGSVVPSPGLTIFPDYQLQTSSDLTNWVPMGERWTGQIGGTNPDLSFANLDAATLFAASLRGADLRFCVLSDADLRFTALHDTKRDEHTRMNAKWKTVWEIVNQGAPGRDLQKADLSFSNISEADLSKADLRLADLSAAFAFQTDFRGANLSNANLRFIDLRGAKLDTNTVVDVKTRLIWRILNEDVSGRDLHGSDLSNAILAEGHLSGGKLANGSYSSTFLHSSHLS